MQISETKVWKKLTQHCEEIDELSLTDLFKQKNRFEKFSLNVGDMLIDFSKQKISEKTIELLLELTKLCKVEEKIQLMFKGENINFTENKPAFHVALRSKNTIKDVKDVLKKIENLVYKLNSKKYLGFTNNVITDVISLGIGGSDLGPRLGCAALEGYKESHINMHFLNNIDGTSISKLLKKLNPETTLCIINSKSFTTQETIIVAEIIKNWFINFFKVKNSYQPHLVAVTANIQNALDFGIKQENIFQMWDWVGGRYSIWSAVGLPIAISCGMKNFYNFLQGAYEMDQHFLTTPIEKNAPIMMALIGIWNNNFFEYPSLSINPYLDGLELLPSYLQQLEMESNGKSINNFSEHVMHSTSPVIWGGVGCNNQHAYMQLLHQGTYIVPVDFIGAVNLCSDYKKLNQLLFTSCICQSKALMDGNISEDLDDMIKINQKSNKLKLSHKICVGNRPSTVVLFPNMSPANLGKLIALYEHKVFVQGIIWQIQSFDQWGVELGKKLINNMMPTFNSRENEDILKFVGNKLDSSTKGLLQYYVKYIDSKDEN